MLQKTTPTIESTLQASEILALNEHTMHKGMETEAYLGKMNSPLNYAPATITTTIGTGVIASSTVGASNTAIAGWITGATASSVMGVGIAVGVVLITYAAYSAYKSYNENKNYAELKTTLHTTLKKLSNSDTTLKHDLRKSLGEETYNEIIKQGPSFIEQISTNSKLKTPSIADDLDFTQNTKLHNEYKNLILEGKMSDEYSTDKIENDHSTEELGQTYDLHESLN